MSMYQDHRRYSMRVWKVWWVTEEAMIGWAVFLRFCSGLCRPTRHETRSHW